MRVLMISGDANILKEGTEASNRLSLQRSQVEELKVYIWPKQGFLKPLFERGKFDVVTAQDPFWRGLVAWVVARRSGAKLNLQVHADLRGQSLAKHVLAQVLLRHADSVRVVSEEIKKQLMHMEVKAPVSVLPIFVDIERFTRIERKSHEEKQMLWIGRLVAEKNPSEAIEILRGVRARGVDAKLIMLGIGSEEKKLNELAKRFSIQFAGWQDPTKYLAIADVVISTSKFESFGASTIEALAAGVPVVSFDVGVAREAGATVVSSREEMISAVIAALNSNTKGELRMKLLNKEEWAVAWRETL
jgi:glycosyltransferase involved in cell wall biosynthesis